MRDVIQMAPPQTPFLIRLNSPAARCLNETFFEQKYYNFGSKASLPFRKSWLHALSLGYNSEIQLDIHTENQRRG